MIQSTTIYPPRDFIEGIDACRGQLLRQARLRTLQAPGVAPRGADAAELASIGRGMLHDLYDLTIDLELECSTEGGCIKDKHAGCAGHGRGLSVG